MNTPITNNFLFDKLLNLLLIFKIWCTKVQVFLRLPARVCAKKSKKIFFEKNRFLCGFTIRFFLLPLHDLLDLSEMKRYIFIVLAFCLTLIGCRQQTDDGTLIHREFYQTVWERFDFVSNTISVSEPTTFDLGLRISFTENYPYESISLVFTVFTAENTPYRSKGYKFRVKDNEGNWKSELVDGCYTFELPINKALQLTESGTYRFQIEQTMPVTPLIGVTELTLFDNNKISK